MVDTYTAGCIAGCRAQVEVGRIQSASTTRAIDITASDDVAVSALQTLSIRSGSTTNSNVGVVATGTDASVVIDASLKLQMGAARYGVYRYLCLIFIG